LKEKIEDNQGDRRSFLRKLAAGVGVGVAGLLLQQELIKSANAQVWAGDVAFSDGIGWIYDTTHKFFWDNTNKRLGVGTSSPLYALDLRTPGSTAAQMHFASTNTDAGGYFVSAGGSNFYVSGGAAYNGTSWIAKAASAYVIGGDASGIRFYHNTGLTAGGAFSPTPRMKIDPAGNVGIGTTTPTQKLHVAGSFLRVDGAGNEQAYIGGDGAGADVQLGSLNVAISTVALWNASAGTRMDLYLRSIIAGGNVTQPVANSGLVKAGAEVSSAGALLKGFNNLPGGTGPTVTKLATGQYEVNFGVNISARYYSATLYDTGMIRVQPRFGVANAVWVNTMNTAGTTTDKRFYLLIY